MYWRVQVRLPRDSGLPEDDVVNVWHFDSDLDTDTPDDGAGAIAIDGDWANIYTPLEDFYQAIEGYLSQDLTGAVHMKGYRLSDAEPRVPLRQGSVGPLNVVGNQALPAEVALALSYQAAMPSGVNPRRRRGRIYLGPFNVNAAADDVGDSRPATTFRTAVVDAADALLTYTNANVDRPKWAVFSPTTLGNVNDPTAAQLDAAFHDVVSGWVDNAWDIQRRRGMAASTRSTFAL